MKKFDKEASEINVKIFELFLNPGINKDNARAWVFFSVSIKAICDSIYQMALRVLKEEHEKEKKK